jgi:hypothetical protein
MPGRYKLLDVAAYYDHLGKVFNSFLAMGIISSGIIAALPLSVSKPMVI